MKNQRPTLTEEQILWSKGFTHVIGIDEVGRGAFAGPVVAAAVVFDMHFFNKETPSAKSLLAKVNDSKLLSPSKREALAALIKRHCLFFVTSEISVHSINTFGIGKATAMAFRKVLAVLEKKIPKKKRFVLVDGFYVPYVRGIGIKNQKAIIKGDQKSISIAAASIIAKVYRDRRMIELDEKYKGYHFARNKGYGTASHRFSIKQYGLSKIHRTSFDLQRYC